MTDPNLQTSLLSFMMVITWVILLWKQFRSTNKTFRILPDPYVIEEVNKLKKINGWFWIIFSAFGIMVIIYLVLPDYYFIFFPLDRFHQPVINITGLILLLISLVWIMTVQLSIDKELFKYKRNIERPSTIQMIIYSERTLLTGMLVLFSGVFVTITNIIGLLLLIFGVFIFFRFSSSETSIFSEN